MTTQSLSRYWRLSGLGLFMLVSLLAVAVVHAHWGLSFSGASAHKSPCTAIW